MRYFLDRLQERSTWLGIFTAIGGAVGVTFAPEFIDVFVGAGLGVAGLILFIVKGETWRAIGGGS